MEATEEHEQVVTTQSNMRPRMTVLVLDMLQTRAGIMAGQMPFYQQAGRRIRKETGGSACQLARKWMIKVFAKLCQAHVL